MMAVADYLTQRGLAGLKDAVFPFGKGRRRASSPLRPCSLPCEFQERLDARVTKKMRGKISLLGLRHDGRVSLRSLIAEVFSPPPHVLTFLS